MNALRPTDLLTGLALLAFLMALLIIRRRRTPPRSATGLLAGPITRAELEAQPGFQPGAAKLYQPEAQEIEAIASQGADVTILGFVGVWCPDSVTQAPRFLKILDLAGIGESQCCLTALDRSKRDKAGLAERYGVRRVPTFVVMRGDDELGRIIERPLETLERDLARILTDAAPNLSLRQTEKEIQAR